MRHIAIVGAGALGSHVALFARNWDALLSRRWKSRLQLTVIDFDRIEQKNTQAQFHTNMSLRQNKAQALQRAMQGMFGIKANAIPRKLTEDNVAALLGRSEDDAGVMQIDEATILVIDCTDNIAARKVIQGYCKQFDIPCLHGCLSGDGTFARVVWTEHFTPDPEGEEGEATCEDGEQLPLFATAAGVIASTAQRYLADGLKQSFQVSAGSIVRLA